MGSETRVQITLHCEEFCHRLYVIFVDHFTKSELVVHDYLNLHINNNNNNNIITALHKCKAVLLLWFYATRSLLQIVLRASK